jgi:hypothetical protein
MKRFFLAAVLLVAMAASAAAQNSVGSLYGSFARERGAESVRVGGIMCRFAAAAAKSERNKDRDDKLAASIMGDVSNIYVLDMSDCNPAVQDKFRNAVSRIETAGYEKLMEVSDDDDQAVIYIKASGDRIRDFLIYSLGDAPCLVSISGNFKRSDIQALIACADEQGDRL